MPARVLDATLVPGAACSAALAGTLGAVSSDFEALTRTLARERV